ncbi:hypothetical protein PIB30_013197 [Stylosanthes scabra]|uniref:DUF4283 domain-containing protein n=1 Tax=Stylosanthes scabra TaxID=79078 RepID=A0ABU6Z840_9FABA|nr:hypothetical protein [Stylosanthes scabra]
MQAIQRLDGWKVWGCVLKLTEARYKRTEQRKLDGAEAKADARVYRWVEKGRETGERSFRDVVLNKKGNDASPVGNDASTMIREDRGIQILGNSKLVLKADENLKKMLNRSLVGELLKPRRFEELREGVTKECKDMVDMKMMGSWKVIMVFNSVEAMVEAEQSTPLRNQFMDVRRWSPGETNGLRRFWLEFIGLPANSWTIQNMERIGNVWGTVLKIDDGNEEHFNAFRILVDAKFSPIIQAVLTVVIEGGEYLVTVKEIGVPNMINNVEVAVMKDGERGEGENRKEDKRYGHDSGERDIENSINGSNHEIGEMNKEEREGSRERPEMKKDLS